jgi:hypothetical protein
MGASPKLLTPEWEPFFYHEEQARLWASTCRFATVHAGRGGGKTAIARRKILLRAARFRKPHGYFVIGAPTREQVKRLYWEPIKRLVPDWWLLEEPREGDLTLKLKNLAVIQCMSMERPQRVEGVPYLDGIVLDEYADMSPDAWTKHIRPALSRRGREGWAWFVGVPEGQNHYYEMHLHAVENRHLGIWDDFGWASADILNASEIEQAQSELDARTFSQEYCGEFVSATGRVYYPFTRDENVREDVAYRKAADLIFSLDFNWNPAIANISQRADNGDDLGVDEVHLEHATCKEVAEVLVERYQGHEGRIVVYGDATGGAMGSAKVEGSDWDIVKRVFRNRFSKARVSYRVPKSNPLERPRVNATNARIQAADGTRHFFLHPRCKHRIRDYEGVQAVSDGSGRIDKGANKMLSHHSDGDGYYFYEEYVAGSRKAKHSRLAI